MSRTAEHLPLSSLQVRETGAGRSIASRRRIATALQLAPALVYLSVLFVVPICLVFAYSFFTVDNNFNNVPGFHLDNYATALTDPLFRDLLLRTVLVGLAVAVIAVLISYPFTYIITFVFPLQRQLFFFLVLLSLFSGYLARVYAWRTILGAEGVINNTLLATGVIHQPLLFLLNSWFAVIVALINFLIPLAVLPIYSSMQNVSPRLMEAARDLGSNNLQIVRKIVLPLSLSGVRAAFAFVFILAAGDYVTPSLLGGAHSLMVGNEVAAQFLDIYNWPLGSALAFTLMAAVLAIVSVLTYLMRFLVK